MNAPKGILLHIIIFAIIFSGCNKNEFADETQCLEKFTHKINSINIDDDFTDLEFLKTILDKDSVQIVLLGEQTHDDGTTFETKGRLIKYLHEECGFDVLAFESGFYDCYRAWQQIKLDSNYKSGLQSSVFSMWINVLSFQPFLNYLQSTLNTSRPLELAGFDSQVSGNFIAKEFVNDIKKSGLIEGNSTDLYTFEEFLKRNFRNFATQGGIEMVDSIKLEKDTLMLNQMIQKLNHIPAEKISEENKTKIEFWTLIIRGIKQMVTSKYLSRKGIFKIGNQPMTNLRDVLMAENLIWLTENYLKNKKIILWGANFHFMRNISQVESNIPDEDYKNNTVTMGHVLWNKFKNRIYSIGFFSHEVANDLTANLDSLNTASDDDFLLGDYLHNKNYEYAFIDLRDASQNGCLNFEYFAKFMGYTNYKSKWGNNFDGVFFMDKQERSW